MSEKLINEEKKTVILSYKALHRHGNVAVMKEKLFVLTQQTAARCPQISAAGFFNVNLVMIFTFVNLITTYVIVVIQLV